MMKGFLELQEPFCLQYLLIKYEHAVVIMVLILSPWLPIHSHPFRLQLLLLALDWCTLIAP